MHISLILTITATVIQIIAYLSYNRGVFSGAIRPNITSWIIWGIISLISSASYFSLSNHDLVVSLMPFTVTLIDVATVALIFHRGVFQRVDRFDAGALAVGALAIVFWSLSDSSALANITTQFALIVGTIPTLRGIWYHPSYERPLPWFLWSLAFGVALVVVSLRGASLVAYASPLVQLSLYATVGALAMRRPS